MALDIAIFVDYFIVERREGLEDEDDDLQQQKLQL